MQLLALAKHLGRIVSHPANRWRWTEALLRVVQFRRAVLRGEPVDLPFAFGTRIRCWPDSDTARSVAYFGGLYDFDEMSFLAAYLRPGDHVLDVGANIGTYAVLAGFLVGANGLIDAFEPVPKTVGRLRENVELNNLAGRVNVHALAVGDTDGWVEMTTELDAVNRVAVPGSPNTARVPVVRLDGILSQAAPVFGKLDVEGVEWSVLKGSQSMLERRTPPIWMVEVNGALERYGFEVRSFIEWMRLRGFAPAKYDARAKSLRFSDQAWDDVFFIALDRLDTVRQRVPGIRFEGLPDAARSSSG